MNFSPDVLALNPSLKRKRPARPAKGKPKRGQYKNDYEEQAALWVAERAEWWAYEAIRLRIDGGWYTPDFIYLERDTDVLVVVEVKGSKQMKNARAGLGKFKAAADRWPMRFVLLTPARKHQKNKRIIVDEWQVEETFVNVSD